MMDVSGLDEAESLPAAPIEHRAHPAGVRGGGAGGAGGLIDGKLRTGRLAGLTMGAAIWALSWPILCESLLNSCTGLVDAWIASKLSQAAADAVSAAAYVTWFVGLITMAIGVGATALISRSIGAGKVAVARAALGQAVLLAIFGGLVATALLVLAAWPLATLLSMTGQVKHDFRVFLWAYAAGVPFSTLLFAGTACARGAGDTLRPLWTMIAVNLVNLPLSYALGIWAGLGVMGVGMGTAAAHVVGAMLILSFHVRGLSGVMLLRRWMRWHPVTAYRLIRLGLPNFLETFGMWVVNFMVILMVGWMSAAAVSAHGVTAVGDSGGLLGAHLWGIRIESFSFLPGFSMGIAAGALCGQYLGAGSPAMARRAALRCALIAATIMGSVGLGLIFLGGPIARMLSDQPAHRELVPGLLFIAGCVQVPFALGIVFRSAMHGAGDVRAVMIMTWITQWGLRLPMAYALSGVDIPLPSSLHAWWGAEAIRNPFPFDWGLKGLWLGLCSEIVIRAAVYAGRFFHGGWAKARV